MLFCRRRLAVALILIVLLRGRLSLIGLVVPRATGACFPVLIIFFLMKNELKHFQVVFQHGSRRPDTSRHQRHIIVAVAPYLPSTLSRNERMVRATETPAQSGRASIQLDRDIDRNPFGYPLHSL